MNLDLKGSNPFLCLYMFASADINFIIISTARSYKVQVAND